jgi:hypothetical protein
MGMGIQPPLPPPGVPPPPGPPPPPGLAAAAALQVKGKGPSGPRRAGEGVEEEEQQVVTMVGRCRLTLSNPR